ncbi:SDR family oxidoreductase [Streptomyces sp. NPDC058001]|uniref:SDR family oxidoreductase n=1 Tax=Streptomyces sp. NPDC058001 TaxID=3346300 RepID=UPI0036EE60C2
MSGNPGAKLSGKTLLLSGGSRGIGLAIALRAAADGANVALLAKTAQPHPRLEGTVYTAAEEIEKAGGTALPIVGDVRDDEDVAAAVEATVRTFGGIDIVVNNASAIDLSKTDALPMKKYDLLQSVNARGTFLLSKTCLPSLRAAENPHILTLSPPLNLRPAWAGRHLGYTISKYGMSLVTLGLADELRDEGIAVNSLWPHTVVATAAVRVLFGGDTALARARTPQIMADAAYAVLTRDARSCTGNFFIDDEVLAAEGMSAADLDRYRYAGAETDTDLETDIFLDT